MKSSCLTHRFEIISNFFSFIGLFCVASRAQSACRADISLAVSNSSLFASNGKGARNTIVFPSVFSLKENGDMLFLGFFRLVELRIHSFLVSFLFSNQ